jgi:predicted  nucleic acid-binding Zn-ribbon protein
MPNQYLKVDDFLIYDAQLTRRLGRIDDNIEALRGQVSNLTGAFTAYVAETDKYRNETDKRLNNIEGELADIKRTVITLAQTMNRGFALIFERLGIQP